MECIECGKQLRGNNKCGYCYDHRDLSPERKKWRKKNYSKNIDKIRERDKDRYYNGKRKERIISYNKENSEKRNEKQRERRRKNPEKYREKDRKRDRSEYLRDRYYNDPLFNLRSRISSSFKNWYRNKNNSTFKKTGYSKEEYFEVLRNRFENDFPYSVFEECLLSGEWHIDHIIPVSLAGNDVDLIKLYQPKNLRLITAEENLQKQNKIIKEEIMKYDLENLFEEVGGVL